MSRAEDTTVRKTDFSDQVADYINNHLAPEEAQRLEAAMRDDPALAEQVHFERTIQASVRAETPDAQAAMPHFSAVRAHIDGRRPRPSLGRLTWLVPAFSAALIVVVGIGVLRDAPPQANEFQTLSDPTEATVGPMLRIVATPQAGVDGLREVIDDYGLEALTWHTQSGTVDVKIPAGDVQTWTARLNEDQRVRYVAARGLAP